MISYSFQRHPSDSLDILIARIGGITNPDSGQCHGSSIINFERRAFASYDGRFKYVDPQLHPMFTKPARR